MQLLIADLVLPDLMLPVSSAGRWLVIGWLAILGGMLGSFMNVVIYRMPRGMSLSHPGSHCPACGHPIRWSDNVPVVGWLRLGGRCRDCGVAISARYPTVEALVAAIAAAICWSAIAPEGAAIGDTSPVYMVNVALVAVELLLACTLVCAALVELDGYLAPPRLLLSTGIAGAVLAGLWPEARGAMQAGVDGWQGVYDGGLGLLAALVLGLLTWPAWSSSAQKHAIAGRTTAAGLLLLVGLLLGAASVTAIAVASMALFTAARLVAKVWRPAGRFGWAAALAAGTLSWIELRPLVSANWLSEAAGREIDLFVAAGVGCALSAVIAFWLAATEQRSGRPGDVT